MWYVICWMNKLGLVYHITIARFSEEKPLEEKDVPEIISGPYSYYAGADYFLRKMG